MACKRKLCKNCCRQKSLEDFYVNRQSCDGRANPCKTCWKARDRLRYATQLARRQKVAQNKTRMRRKTANFIRSYLKMHPCVDCGEADIVVLDFDHIRGQKKDKISSMRKNCCITTIKQEIAKCVVRCANCHRRRTAKQFGWRR
ncbi:hypothetical protein EBZ39_04775 [bacterium]|nr:hypothetical protein [bacterium]